MPYANLTNPQTLNLYAMVSDNPESFVDLDGHGTNDQSNSQPGNCASAGSAAGGKQDAAQNAGTATVNYVPYEVHGSTAAEAMEQANAGGYAGNTSFTIAPTAQASYSVTPGANGSVSVTATATGVQVSMTITVSTPHWAAEKSASSEDQKTWDQAANSNMAHEQAHVQMDKAAIPGIAKALTGTSATAKGQTKLTLLCPAASLGLRLGRRRHFRRRTTRSTRTLITEGKIEFIAQRCWPQKRSRLSSVPRFTPPCTSRSSAGAEG